MSYTSNDWTRFRAAAYSDWFSLPNAHALRRQLATVNYSVIASRLEGQNFLAQFQQEGVEGNNLFGTSTRFPNLMKDTYVTTFQTEFNTLLNELQASLSWRETNQAKDIQAGKADSGNRGQTQGSQGHATDEIKETTVQDNTRRFNALRNEFNMKITKQETLWCQREFEQRLNITWA